MSLLFGMPANLPPDLEAALAAIQVWSDDVGSKWVDVPYATSNFRAVTGTWTVDQGDQRLFQYKTIQDTLYMRVAVLNTSTSAGFGNDIRILIPNGLKARDIYFVGIAQWNADSAGVDGIARVFPSSDGRFLRIVRDVLASSTAWPSSEANTFTLQLNVHFPIIVATP